MKKFESEKTLINATSEQVYIFLSNFNHFQKLMPEQIINWQSTEDRCSFTIKGMTDIHLKIDEKIPFVKIVMGPDGKTSVNYKLVSVLESNGDNKCHATLTFEADLNPMLQMMASTPLKNFVNLLASKLQQLFENGSPI